MHKKILVTIATARAYALRRETVRNTWIRDIRRKNLNVEYFFFYGKTDRDIPVEEEEDLLELDCPDLYEYLPDKHWRAFRHALENKTFDYIFDCDDDTFVDLEKLCSLVDEAPETGLRGEVISAGYDDRLTISGGAGLLISRRRVEEIVAARLPIQGCDDLLIYDYCREHQLDYCNDERFSHDKFRFPLLTNPFITSHWLTPQEMEMIYEVYDKVPLGSYSDISFYSSDGRIYAVRKENENRYLLGEVENKGDNIFLIKWEDSSVLSRVEDDFVIERLSALNLDVRRESFLPDNPRVAIICVSYKRYEHVLRQLYWALMQDYSNCALFFAVKGLDEYQFNRHLINEFKPFMDSGRLLVRLFPNKNQFSNMIDPLRGVDLDEFDLFVKIDDDDFYSLSYISDCVSLHRRYPADCSSVVYVRESLTKTEQDMPLMMMSSSNVIGNVSVFSRIVMKEFADCENNDVKLSALSEEYYRNSEMHFGQNEDQVLDMLMKRHGLIDRRCRSFDNFHLMINGSTVSMMRSRDNKTYLMDRFRRGNCKNIDSGESWEYVVRMKHPVWERVYILFEKNGYPLDEPEICHFKVLYFDNEVLVVKWLSYGVEVFRKDHSGMFVFQECDGNSSSAVPEYLTLKMDNFLFKCRVKDDQILCDNFMKPAQIKNNSGYLLNCLMADIEYWFLNIRDDMYVNIETPVSSSD